MADLVVVGSFMMDLVARTPSLPRPGETVIGESFAQFLGGKGFNQAVAAARSGGNVAMVGRVGDDSFGREFLDALDREGIDRRGVSIDPQEGTGVGLPVVESSGQNAIVVIPRANHALQHVDADAFAGAKVVLLQWELSPRVTVEAARLAKAAGAIVVLNPAPAVGALSDYDGLIDVLVPNETEAAVLGDLPDVDVVLTLGEKGALVRSGGREERFEPHDVECIDTVGAGDAFCGALCAALASGASLFDAARIGNAAGALAVTKAGAEPSMPHRADIDRLLG
ncbi:MAG: ribokinase [Actinomycetota bacterium]|nr:ribokinase [Actinomycetota bacterium]